jgi:hypothetical protein
MSHSFRDDAPARRGKVLTAANFLQEPLFVFFSEDAAGTSDDAKRPVKYSRRRKGCLMHQ